MQKHSSGLRLISVSFDESMKDVERVLQRSVSQNPTLAKLKEWGITASGGDVRRNALEVLRKKGIGIDKTSEEAVLATLRLLGADFEKLAVLEREPFRAAFGKNADLYLVPEKSRDLCYQAVGGSSLPMIFVIDRKGKLRYAGYPMEDSVTKLVEALLGEEKPD